MNIKHQPQQKSIAYPSDAKSRTRLAAALGLVSTLALAACNDSPVDPTSGDPAMVSSSSSQSVESPEGGVIEMDPSSSSQSSSSSEIMGGVSSAYQEPLSGDIYIEPDVSSSSGQSSSSSEDEIKVEIVEPYVTGGVVMYDPPEYSSSSESSSSSTKSP